jgi:hypothetical protein
MLAWFHDDKSATYGDRRLASAAASVREAVGLLREIRKRDS